MVFGRWVAQLLLLCCAQLVSSSPSYSVERKSNLRVKTFDGFLLHANAMIPVSNSSSASFPVIVMANSWGVPGFEYIVEALKLAERGFIVLEYEARGWYESQGLIGTAGPLDQMDTKTCISFVLNQTAWKPDKTRIGLLGISYGAGLALLGGANDPRVTTVVAMSGWGSLLDALDEAFSPNLVWGQLLVSIGKVVGREDPSLSQYWHDLLTFTNFSAVESFARARSPENPLFLDKINARKLPVFLSNNFEDEIFKPQDQLRLFTKLQGPKRILLNQGIHATAEIGGLLDIPDNYVWQQATSWLKYFLRGEGEDPTHPAVTFQLRNQKSNHIHLDSYPSPDIKSLTLYLTERSGNNIFGGLSSSSSALGSNSISFAKRVGMSDGVPVMGELLQVFADLPILADLALTKKEHSIVFVSEHLKQETRLCGDATLNLPFIPNSDHWQVVAFLYAMGDIPLDYEGKLLSHGVRTCFNCTAGTPQNALIRLRSLCDDVPKSHRLALGISLYSDLYQPVNTASSLELKLTYGQAATFNIDTQTI